MFPQTKSISARLREKYIIVLDHFFGFTSECDAGYYGKNCTKLCGHCIESKKCHHVSGICSKGCEPGYRGNTCEKG